MNFKNEIKEIKKGRKTRFAGGCSREVYESDCGKFVIKHACFYNRKHNKSEVHLWRKSKSFLLNPIVWHTRSFDFIVQPKLKVLKRDFCWSDSAESASHKREIIKMFGFKNWFQVEDIDCTFAKGGLKGSKNPMVKELRRLYELGLPCDDLHLGNWGEDILGRFILIDYSTIL